MSYGREPKSCLGCVFNFRLGRFGRYCMEVEVMLMTSSKGPDFVLSVKTHLWRNIPKHSSLLLRCVNIHNARVYDVGPL